MEEGLITKASSYILIVLVFGVLMQFTLHFSQVLSYDQSLHAERNAQIHDDLSNAIPQTPQDIATPLLPSGYPVEAAAGKGPVTAPVPFWNKPVCKDNFWCEMILGVNPWGGGSVRLWEVPLSLGLWLLTLLGGVGLYARMGLWGGRLALLAERLPALARAFEYGSRFLVWARELPAVAKSLDLLRSIKPAMLEEFPKIGKAFDYLKVKGAFRAGDSLVKAQSTTILTTTRNEMMNGYNGIKPNWSIKSILPWWGETTPWGIANGFKNWFISLALNYTGRGSLFGGLRTLALDIRPVGTALKEFFLNLSFRGVLTGAKNAPRAAFYFLKDVWQGFGMPTKLPPLSEFVNFERSRIGVGFFTLKRIYNAILGPIERGGIPQILKIERMQEVKLIRSPLNSAGSYRWVTATRIQRGEYLNELLDLRGMIRSSMEIAQICASSSTFVWAIGQKIQYGSWPTYPEYIKYYSNTYAESLVFGPLIRVMGPWVSILTSRIPLINRYYLWDDVFGKYFDRMPSKWLSYQANMESSEGSISNMLFGFNTKEGQIADISLRAYNYATGDDLEKRVGSKRFNDLMNQYQEMFDKKPGGAQAFNANVGLMWRLLDMISGKTSGASVSPLLGSDQQEIISNILSNQKRGYLYSSNEIDAGIQRVWELKNKGAYGTDKEFASFKRENGFQLEAIFSYFKTYEMSPNQVINSALQMEQSNFLKNLGASTGYSGQNQLPMQSQIKPVSALQLNLKTPVLQTQAINKYQLWDETKPPEYYMNNFCAKLTGGLSTANAYLKETGTDIGVPALKMHAATITEWLNAGIDVKFTAQATKIGGADYAYKMTQALGVQNIKAMSQYATPEAVINFVKLASPEYTSTLMTKMGVRADVLAKNIASSTPEIMAQAFKIDSRATVSMLNSLKVAGSDAVGIYLKFATPEMGVSAFNAKPNGMVNAIKQFGPEFTGQATRILGDSIAKPQIQTTLARMRSDIGPMNAITLLAEGNMKAVAFYNSNPAAAEYVNFFGPKNAGSLINAAGELNMFSGSVKLSSLNVAALNVFASNIGAENAAKLVESIGSRDALRLMYSPVAQNAAQYINKFGVAEFGRIVQSTGIENAIQMLGTQYNSDTSSLSSTVFARISADVTAPKARAFLSAGGTASFYNANPSTAELINNFGGTKAGEIAGTLTKMGEVGTISLTPQTVSALNLFAKNIGQSNALRLADNIGMENALKLMSSGAASQASGIIGKYGLGSFIKFTNAVGGVDSAINMLSAQNNGVLAEMRMNGIDAVTAKYASSASASQRSYSNAPVSGLANIHEYYLNNFSAKLTGGLSTANAYLREAGTDIGMPALKMHGATIAEWLNAGIDVKFTAQATKIGGADYVREMTQSIGVQNIKTMSQYANPESIMNFVKLSTPGLTGSLMSEMGVRPDVLAKNIASATPENMALAFKIDASATASMLNSMKVAGGDAIGAYLKFASPETGISAFKANPSGMAKILDQFGPEFTGQVTQVLGVSIAKPEIQATLAKMRADIGPANALSFLAEGNMKAADFYKSNPAAAEYVNFFGPKNAGSLINAAGELNMTGGLARLSFQNVAALNVFASNIGAENAAKLVESIGPKDALRLMYSPVAQNAAQYINKFGVAEFGRIVQSTGIENAIQMLGTQYNSDTSSLSSTVFARISADVTAPNARAFLSAGGTASFYNANPSTAELINNFGGTKAGEITSTLTKMSEAGTINLTPQTVSALNLFAKNVGQSNALRLADNLGLENAIKLMYSEAATPASGIIGKYGLGSFIKFTNAVGGVDSAINMLSAQNNGVLAEMRMNGIDALIAKYASVAPSSPMHSPAGIPVENLTNLQIKELFSEVAPGIAGNKNFNSEAFGTLVKVYRISQSGHNANLISEAFTSSGADVSVFNQIKGTAEALKWKNIPASVENISAVRALIVSGISDYNLKTVEGLNTLSAAAGVDAKTFIDQLTVKDASKILRSAAIDPLAQTITGTGFREFIQLKKTIGVENLVHAINSVPDLADQLKSPGGIDALAAAYGGYAEPGKNVYKGVPITLSPAKNAPTASVSHAQAVGGMDYLTGILAENKLPPTRGNLKAAGILAKNGIAVNSESIRDTSALLANLGAKDTNKLIASSPGEIRAFLKKCAVNILIEFAQGAGLDNAIAALKTNPDLASQAKTDLSSVIAAYRGADVMSQETAPRLLIRTDGRLEPGSQINYKRINRRHSRPGGSTDYLSSDYIGGLGTRLDQLSSEKVTRFRTMLGNLGVDVRIETRIKEGSEIRTFFPDEVALVTPDPSSGRPGVVVFNGNMPVILSLLAAPEETDHVMRSHLWERLEGKYGGITGEEFESATIGNNCYIPLMLNAICYRLREVNPEMALAFSTYAQDELDRFQDNFGKRGARFSIKDLNHLTEALLSGSEQFGSLFDDYLDGVAGFKTVSSPKIRELCDTFYNTLNGKLADLSRENAEEKVYEAVFSAVEADIKLRNGWLYDIIARNESLKEVLKEAGLGDKAALINMHAFDKMLRTLFGGDMEHAAAFLKECGTDILLAYEQDSEPFRKFFRNMGSDNVESSILISKVLVSLSKDNPKISSGLRRINALFEKDYAPRGASSADDFVQMLFNSEKSFGELIRNITASGPAQESDNEPKNVDALHKSSMALEAQLEEAEKYLESLNAKGPGASSITHADTLNEIGFLCEGIASLAEEWAEDFSSQPQDVLNAYTNAYIYYSNAWTAYLEASGRYSESLNTPDVFVPKLLSANTRVTYRSRHVARRMEYLEKKIAELGGSLQQLRDESLAQTPEKTAGYLARDSYETHEKMLENLVPPECWSRLVEEERSIAEESMQEAKNTLLTGPEKSPGVFAFDPVYGDAARMNSFIAQKVVPVLAETFCLSEADVRELSAVAQNAEFSKGTWRVLLDGQKFSHYSHPITSQTEEARLMQGYAELHEISGHLVERFLSEKLNKDPLESSVISGLTAYTEALSMALPKIIAWNLFKNARTEKEASWYNALGRLYYDRQGWEDAQELWNTPASPSEYREKYAKLLKKDIVPHISFLQEDYEMGAVSEEYYSQILAFQELLEIHGYSFDTLAKNLLNAEPLITPIRSKDARPLESVSNIKSTGASLEMAWNALVAGEYTEKEVRRLYSEPGQDIRTELLRDMARLSATILYETDETLRESAKKQCNRLREKIKQVNSELSDEYWSAFLDAVKIVKYLSPGVGETDKEGFFSKSPKTKKHAGPQTKKTIGRVGRILKEKATPKTESETAIPVSDLLRTVVTGGDHTGEALAAVAERYASNIDEVLGARIESQEQTSNRIITLIGQTIAKYGKEEGLKKIKKIGVENKGDVEGVLKAFDAVRKTPPGPGHEAGEITAGQQDNKEDKPKDRPSNVPSTKVLLRYFTSGFSGDFTGILACAENLTDSNLQKYHAEELFNINFLIELLDFRISRLPSEIENKEYLPFVNIKNQFKLLPGQLDLLREKQDYDERKKIFEEIEKTINRINDESEKYLEDLGGYKGDLGSVRDRMLIEYDSVEKVRMQLSIYDKYRKQPHGHLLEAAIHYGIPVSPAKNNVEKGEDGKEQGGSSKTTENFYMNRGITPEEIDQGAKKFVGGIKGFLKEKGVIDRKTEEQRRAEIKDVLGGFLSRSDLSGREIVLREGNPKELIGEHVVMAGETMISSDVYAFFEAGKITVCYDKSFRITPAKAEEIKQHLLLMEHLWKRVKENPGFGTHLEKYLDSGGRMLHIDFAVYLEKVDEGLSNAFLEEYFVPFVNAKDIKELLLATSFVQEYRDILQYAGSSRSAGELSDLLKNSQEESNKEIDGNRRKFYNSLRKIYDETDAVNLTDVFLCIAKMTSSDSSFSISRYFHDKTSLNELQKDVLRLYHNFNNTVSREHILEEIYGKKYFEKNKSSSRDNKALGGEKKDASPALSHGERMALGRAFNEIEVSEGYKGTKISCRREDLDIPNINIEEKIVYDSLPIKNLKLTDVYMTERGLELARKKIDDKTAELTILRTPDEDIILIGNSLVAAAADPGNPVASLKATVYVTKERINLPKEISGKTIKDLRIGDDHGETKSLEEYYKDLHKSSILGGKSPASLAGHIKKAFSVNDIIAARMALGIVPHLESSGVDEKDWPKIIDLLSKRRITEIATTGYGNSVKEAVSRFRKEGEHVSFGRKIIDSLIGRNDKEKESSPTAGEIAKIELSLDDYYNAELLHQIKNKYSLDAGQLKKLIYLLELFIEDCKKEGRGDLGLECETQLRDCKERLKSIEEKYPYELLKALERDINAAADEESIRRIFKDLENALRLFSSDYERLGQLMQLYYELNKKASELRGMGLFDDSLENACNEWMERCSKKRDELKAPAKKSVEKKPEPAKLGVKTGKINPDGTEEIKYYGSIIGPAGPIITEKLSEAEKKLRNAITKPAKPPAAEESQEQSLKTPEWVIRISGKSIPEIINLMASNPKNAGELETVLTDLKSGKNTGMKDSGTGRMVSSAVEKLSLITNAAEQVYTRACRLPSAYDSFDQYAILKNLEPSDIRNAEIESGSLIPSNAESAESKAKEAIAGRVADDKEAHLVALKDPSGDDSKAYLISRDDLAYVRGLSENGKINVLLIETKKAEEAKPVKAGNESVKEILERTSREGTGTLDAILTRMDPNGLEIFEAVNISGCVSDDKTRSEQSSFPSYSGTRDHVKVSALPAGLSFERLASKDWPGVEAEVSVLISKSLGEKHPVDLVAANARAEDAINLLARDQGRIVGVCLGYGTQAFGKDKTLNVGTWAVTQSMQKSGIGSMLFGQIMQEAKKDGYRHLTATTRKKHMPPGATKISEIPNLLNTNETFINWKLDLRKVNYDGTLLSGPEEKYLSDVLGGVLKRMDPNGLEILEAEQASRVKEANEALALAEDEFYENTHFLNPKEYTEILALFYKVLETDPGNHLALAGIGKTTLLFESMTSSGDPKNPLILTAFKFIQEALILQPSLRKEIDDWLAKYTAKRSSLGAGWYVRGKLLADYDPDSAIRIYDEAMRSDRENPIGPAQNLRLAKAELLLEKGRYLEAKDLAVKARDVLYRQNEIAIKSERSHDWKTNTEIRSYLIEGKAQMMLGELGLSEESFDEAITLSLTPQVVQNVDYTGRSTKAEILLEKARTLLRLGKAEEAVRELDSAKKIVDAKKDDWPLFLVNHASFYKELGDSYPPGHDNEKKDCLVKALDLARQAAQKNKDDAHIFSPEVQRMAGKLTKYLVKDPEKEINGKDYKSDILGGASKSSLINSLNSEGLGKADDPKKVADWIISNCRHQEDWLAVATRFREAKIRTGKTDAEVTEKLFDVIDGFRNRESIDKGDVKEILLLSTKFRQPNDMVRLTKILLFHIAEDEKSGKTATSERIEESLDELRKRLQDNKNDLDVVEGFARWVRYEASGRTDTRGMMSAGSQGWWTKEGLERLRKDGAGGVSARISLGPVDGLSQGITLDNPSSIDEFDRQFMDYCDRVISYYHKNNPNKFQSLYGITLKNFRENYKLHDPKRKTDVQTALIRLIGNWFGSKRINGDRKALLKMLCDRRGIESGFVYVEGGFTNYVKIGPTKYVLNPETLEMKQSYKYKNPVEIDAGTFTILTKIDRLVNAGNFDEAEGYLKDMVNGKYPFSEKIREDYTQKKKQFRERSAQEQDTREETKSSGENISDGAALDAQEDSKAATTFTIEAISDVKVIDSFGMNYQDLSSGEIASLLVTAARGREDLSEKALGVLMDCFLAYPDIFSAEGEIITIFAPVAAGAGIDLGPVLGKIRDAINHYNMGCELFDSAAVKRKAFSGAWKHFDDAVRICPSFKAAAINRDLCSYYMIAKNEQSKDVLIIEPVKGYNYFKEALYEIQGVDTHIKNKYGNRSRIGKDYQTYRYRLIRESVRLFFETGGYPLISFLLTEKKLAESIPFEKLGCIVNGLIPVARADWELAGTMGECLINNPDSFTSKSIPPIARNMLRVLKEPEGKKLSKMFFESISFSPGYFNDRPDRIEKHAEAIIRDGRAPQIPNLNQSGQDPGISTRFGGMPWIDASGESEENRPDRRAIDAGRKAVRNMLSEKLDKLDREISWKYAGFDRYVILLNATQVYERTGIDGALDYLDSISESFEFANSHRYAKSILSSRMSFGILSRYMMIIGLEKESENSVIFDKGYALGYSHYAMNYYDKIPDHNALETVSRHYSNFRGNYGKWVLVAQSYVNAVTGKTEFLSGGRMILEAIAEDFNLIASRSAETVREEAEKDGIAPAPLMDAVREFELSLRDYPKYFLTPEDVHHFASTVYERFMGEPLHPQYQSNVPMPSSVEGIVLTPKNADEFLKKLEKFGVKEAIIQLDETNLKNFAEEHYRWPRDKIAGFAIEGMGHGQTIAKEISIKHGKPFVEVKRSHVDSNGKKSIREEPYNDGEKVQIYKDEQGRYRIRDKTHEVGSRHSGTDSHMDSLPSVVVFDESVRKLVKALPKDHPAKALLWTHGGKGVKFLEKCMKLGIPVQWESHDKIKERTDLGVLPGEKKIAEENDAKGKRGFVSGANDAIVLSDSAPAYLIYSRLRRETDILSAGILYPELSGPQLERIAYVSDAYAILEYHALAEKIRAKAPETAEVFDAIARQEYVTLAMKAGIFGEYEGFVSKYGGDEIGLLSAALKVPEQAIDYVVVLEEEHVSNISSLSGRFRKTMRKRDVEAEAVKALGGWAYSGMKARRDYSFTVERLPEVEKDAGPEAGGNAEALRAEEEGDRSIKKGVPVDAARLYSEAFLEYTRLKDEPGTDRIASKLAESALNAALINMGEVETGDKMEDNYYLSLYNIFLALEGVSWILGRMNKSSLDDSSDKLSLFADIAQTMQKVTKKIDDAYAHEHDPAHEDIKEDLDELLSLLTDSSARLNAILPALEDYASSIRLAWETIDMILNSSILRDKKVEQVLEPSWETRYALRPGQTVQGLYAELIAKYPKGMVPLNVAYTLDADDVLVQLVYSYKDLPAEVRKWLRENDVAALSVNDIIYVSEEDAKRFKDMGPFNNANTNEDAGKPLTPRGTEAVTRMENLMIAPTEEKITSGIVLLDHGIAITAENIRLTPGEIERRIAIIKKYGVAPDEENLLWEWDRRSSYRLVEYGPKSDEFDDLPVLSDEIAESFRDEEHGYAILLPGCIIHRLQETGRELGRYYGLVLPVTPKHGEMLYDLKVSEGGKVKKQRNTYMVVKETKVYYGMVARGEGKQIYVPKNVKLDEVLMTVTKREKDELWERENKNAGDVQNNGKGTQTEAIKLVPGQNEAVAGHLAANASLYGRDSGQAAIDIGGTLYEIENEAAASGGYSDVSVVSVLNKKTGEARRFAVKAFKIVKIDLDDLGVSEQAKAQEEVSAFGVAPQVYAYSDEKKNIVMEGLGSEWNNFDESMLSDPAILSNLGEAFLKMHSVAVHGDPHMKNVWVSNKKDIYFTDYGRSKINKEHPDSLIRFQVEELMKNLLEGFLIEFADNISPLEIKDAHQKVVDSYMKGGGLQRIAGYVKNNPGESHILYLLPEKYRNEIIKEATDQTNTEPAERFNSEMDELSVKAIINSLEHLNQDKKPPLYSHDPVSTGFFDIANNGLLHEARNVLGVDYQGSVFFEAGSGRSFHGRADGHIHAAVDDAKAVEPIISTLTGGRMVPEEQREVLRQAVRVCIAVEEGLVHGLMRAHSNSMMPDAIGQVITEADKYLEGFAYHARIELFGRLRDKETDLGRRAYYDLLIDVSKKLELMLPLFSVGEQSQRYRDQIEKISELKDKSSLGELLKKMSAQKVIDTGILDEDLRPLGRDEVNALADKIKLEDFYPERMIAQLAVTAAYADEKEVRDHADQLLLELCAGTENGSEKYLAPKRVVETLEKLACILPG